MSKPKKSDKSEPEEGDEEGVVKPAPWAIEIEFYNKPSFMVSVLELKVDNEHVSLVRDDGVLLAYPYEGVRKVLVMQTKRPKHNLD